MNSAFSFSRRVLAAFLLRSLMSARVPKNKNNPIMAKRSRAESMYPPHQHGDGRTDMIILFTTHIYDIILYYIIYVFTAAGEHFESDIRRGTLYNIQQPVILYYYEFFNLKFAFQTHGGGCRAEKRCTPIIRKTPINAYHTAVCGILLQATAEKSLLPRRLALAGTPRLYVVQTIGTKNNYIRPRTRAQYIQCAVCLPKQP